MKTKHKKILLFTLFLIIINLLYFLIPWGVLFLQNELLGQSTYLTDFLGFSFLTPAVLLMQGVMLYRYFFKGTSKKVFIYISISVLFFHSALAVTPFEYCDGGLWSKSSCDCLGIKKYQLFGSECVGVREKCYDLGTSNKYERPCNNR